MISYFVKWFHLIISVVFACSACTAISNLNTERLKVPEYFACQVNNQKSNSNINQFLDNLIPHCGFWGVSAKSIGKNKSLVNWNGDYPFVPASNMKLLTTAVALIRLGPDYRFNTSLLSDAPIINGVLKGNLVLRGVGDPTISDKFHKNSAIVFDDWAEQLKKRGISEIEGDIVGDDDLFDDNDVGKGWTWEDDLFYYSARISALSYNDNCIDVVVAPAANSGDPAIISMKPHTSYVYIDNHVITKSVGQKSDFHGRRNRTTSSIELMGSIEKGVAPYRFKLSVANPTLFTVTVLKEVLEQRGIKVRGYPIDIDEITTDKPDYDQLRILASYQSVPLSMIVKFINKESQNLYAELAFRTLGAKFEGRGSTENAVKVIRQTLELMGIKGDSLHINDGSGLSRLNLVSPNQIVSLLDYMSHHPFFNEFYAALPIAGRDGTLAGRMNNTGMTDRMRAKTGTLTHVSALSGYLCTGNDELVAFSILGNNILSPAAEVRALQEDLCQQILTLDAGE
jgi:D-alanyl-D-alanine carboxypeptidase/D-alanyl-D-alanine-endopeptidase (penicillin-binding protein 4)